MFLYPQNQIPRLHAYLGWDQTPDKESTGNTHAPLAQQCQGVKALSWNGTILPLYVGEAQ